MGERPLLGEGFGYRALVAIGRMRFVHDTTLPGQYESNARGEPPVSWQFAGRISAFSEELRDGQLPSGA
ncbi:hypothetical protein D7316_05302 [Gordonia insulae]|uniref:Uncharacterized protein n=1 Tax=Gordonia insulae TaxID=2420509 RepID=A0A3G8JVQ7_9ACTN|nr:hypothetical protein D7316_05302 [Gordonia insulae]